MPRTGKILLVDGDDERRQTVTQEIEKNGYNIDPVKDFQAAKNAVASRSPAVILCAAAPGLNQALGFCAELREGADLRKAAPFLVYAAKMEEVLRLRFLEAGADELVAVGSLREVLDARFQQLQGREEGSETDSAGVLMEPVSIRERVEETSLAEATRSQMFFRLGAGELANALQFLSTTHRTGELRLKDSGSAEQALRGRIYIVDGKLVHAEAGEDTGVNALALMIAMENVDARFYEKKTTERETLGGRTDHILLQASVLSDELRQIQKELPLERVIEKTDKAEGLTGLPESRSAILAAIDGFRTLAEVFQTAGVTLTVGYMEIKALREGEMLREVPETEVQKRRVGGRLAEVLARIEAAVEAAGSPEEALALLERVVEVLPPGKNGRD